MPKLLIQKHNGRLRVLDVYTHEDTEVLDSSRSSSDSGGGSSNGGDDDGPNTDDDDFIGNGTEEAAAEPLAAPSAADQTPDMTLPLFARRMLLSIYGRRLLITDVNNGLKVRLLLTLDAKQTTVLHTCKHKVGLYLLSTIHF